MARTGASSAGGGETSFYRWIQSVHGINFVSNDDMTTGRVHLMPINIPVAMTIESIIVQQFTGVVAGNMRLGIYEDAGDTPATADLVVESASVAKAGTWRSQEVAIASTELEAGVYWIGIQSDEATTELVLTNLWGTTPNSVQPYYYSRSGGYGAFTDPCPAVTAIDNGPLFYVIVESIP